MKSCCGHQGTAARGKVNRLQKRTARDPVQSDINQAEDVSGANAQEILRRLGLEGSNVPAELEEFIDCHAKSPNDLRPWRASSAALA